jgi:hypothetical protein
MSAAESNEAAVEVGAQTPAACSHCKRGASSERNTQTARSTSHAAGIAQRQVRRQSATSSCPTTER